MRSWAKLIPVACFNVLIYILVKRRQERPNHAAAAGIPMSTFTSSVSRSPQPGVRHLTNTTSTAGS